jgi:hypothetical protein
MVALALTYWPFFTRLVFAETGMTMIIVSHRRQGWQ